MNISKTKRIGILFIISVMLFAPIPYMFQFGQSRAVSYIENQKDIHTCNDTLVVDKSKLYDTYITQEGDTVISIVRDVLGSTDYFFDFVRLNFNNLSEKNSVAGVTQEDLYLLKPGEELLIPHPFTLENDLEPQILVYEGTFHSKTDSSITYIGNGNVKFTYPLHKKAEIYGTKEFKEGDCVMIMLNEQRVIKVAPQEPGYFVKEYES